MKTLELIDKHEHCVKILEAIREARLRRSTIAENLRRSVLPRVYAKQANRLDTYDRVINRLELYYQKKAA